MTTVRSLRIVLAGALAVCVSSCALAASPALASSGAWWGLTSGSWPSILPAGGEGDIILTAQDRGFEAVNATEHPVVVRGVLPEGLEASAIEGHAGASQGRLFDGKMECRRPSTREGECRFEGKWKPGEVEYPHQVGEDHILGAYRQLEVRIAVKASASPKSGEVKVSISGGGAGAPVTVSRPVQVGAAGQSVPFGVERHELLAEEEGGAPDTQAGSHPFQLTDVLDLNTSKAPETVGGFSEEMPAAMTKDLKFQLPPGLVGNPAPLPQCSEEEFVTPAGAGEEGEPGESGDFANQCPADAAVGVATVTFDEPFNLHFETEALPLFNLTPMPGEPARFGFDVHGVDVYLTTSVRTGSDYGVTVHVDNISELDGFLASKTTFWGVPGAAIHDAARGWGCLRGEGPCAALDKSNPPPFMSMPTACTGPMATSVQADSWAQPKPAHPSEPPLFYESTMPGMVGCSHLQFDPQIYVAPDSPDASAPTGLEVKVHVPQTAALNSEGLAEGTVRDTTLTLPAGVTLNPGGAEGLSACTLPEIGFLGKQSGETDLNLFTPTLAEPFCPKEAKIGTVDIHTPLLPNDLEGSVYLATPAPTGEAGMNPFDTLVSMYIVAEDPVSGTVVKLPGKVLRCEQAGETLEGVTCEAPGQLVSTFKDTPQLPFENLVLHFFGGGHAPLATPGLCGSYTTHATFTPWSAEPGSAPARPSASFQITSGPSGGPCPSNPRPFAPEFTAGTVNNQAGSFSELRTTMGHPDVDQPLGGLTLAMPPGLMGSLAGVALCGEPQAAQGTCGPESLIGHTTVTAGLGSTPAVVKRPGNVYITGPYNGHGGCTVGEAGCAPFGLSIANPAEAGPFDLEKGTPCDCVVVRAKVEVDPLTAQLKIVTSALPTMLKGIPLELQHIMVGIDRPSFTFNPTSCEHESFTGTLASGESSATAPISTPFQAANCANLAFKPSFKVSTSGKTSRLDGASLNVKVTYPKGSLGSQANLHYVKVDLPRQLPSNLEALKHACPAATFEANPAACDPISKVGTVVVHTQVLPVPLEGPAIFVSNAGLKFPELVFVLQGYGVTVDVHGETFIDKAGITSSTIRNAPDVPFESFELNLPERPKYAALAAPYGLCNVTRTKIVKKKVAKRVHGKVVRRHGRVIKITKKVKKQVAAGLVMPTHFIGQNGAEIKQNTPIEVTGCAAKAKKKVKRHSKKPKHKKK
jgi:hypothetical protein